MRPTTAAAGSNASWNATTPPVQALIQQGAQAPAPRARTPDGTLIRLVDPPFAQGHQLNAPFVRTDWHPSHRAQPEEGLRGMLLSVQRAGVPPGLIKRAIATFVRDTPDEAPAMCEAILSSGFVKLTADDWAKVRGRRQQVWMGESSDANRAIVGWAAPPEHPNPNTFLVAPLPGQTNELVVGKDVALGMELDLKVVVNEGAGSGLVAVDIEDEGAHPARLRQLSEMQRIGLLKKKTPEFLAQMTLVFQHKAERFRSPEFFDEKQALACEVIHRFLQDGTLHPGLMSDLEVTGPMARHLLDDGLGGLLRYMVACTAATQSWSLCVGHETAAKALYDLAPWPHATERPCTLQMHHGLNAVEGEAVVTFARGVAKTKLSLVLTAELYAAPDALRQIIEDHKGMALLLFKEVHVTIERIVGLLAGIKAIDLRYVSLVGLKAQDDAQLQSMVQVLHSASVRELDVRACAVSLTNAVVACRPWEWLRVVTDDGRAAQMAGLFRNNPISAKTLVISVSGMNAHASVETMVSKCNNLEFLEINGGVNVLSLARALDINRSVRSVKSALLAANESESREANKILLRNTSILNFLVLSVPGGLTASRIPHWLLWAVKKWVTRNRMRHPVLAGIGAGRGFGVAVQELNMKEAGGNVGRYLAEKDSVALSLTSKAAYIGSRQPWENEIDRLADLFTVSNKHVFMDKLTRQLEGLDAEFPTLTGTELWHEFSASSLKEMAVLMQHVGVSDFAIGEALRRRLKMGAAPVQAHLEAMMAVGAYSAETWLLEVAGIDVHATSF